MCRFVIFRLVRLVPLSALLFAVQALAQFEVSPDHFDSDAAKPAARPAGAKVDHRNAPSASLDGPGAVKEKPTARRGDFSLTARRHFTAVCGYPGGNNPTIECGRSFAPKATVKLQNRSVPVAGSRQRSLRAMAPLRLNSACNPWTNNKICG